MSPPPDVNPDVSPGTPGQPVMALPSDAMIVVPVRNTVLFPEIVFPITLGRPATVAAAQQAVREQRQILIVLQREAEKDDPKADDLYRVGTVTNIVRYVTTPDGNHMVICQGVQRFRISEFVEGQPFLMARGLHLAARPRNPVVAVLRRVGERVTHRQGPPLLLEQRRHLLELALVERGLHLFEEQHSWRGLERSQRPGGQTFSLSELVTIALEPALCPRSDAVGLGNQIADRERTKRPK